MIKLNLLRPRWSGKLPVGEIETLKFRYPKLSNSAIVWLWTSITIHKLAMGYEHKNAAPQNTSQNNPTNLQNRQFQPHHGKVIPR
jgi:hypothetical protein